MEFHPCRLSLCSNKRISDHVPFRNSKLTRMLQPSLSGDARISVICTINPDKDAVGESTSTLLFAQRIKKVQVSCSAFLVSQLCMKPMIVRCSFVPRRRKSWIRTLCLKDTGRRSRISSNGSKSESERPMLQLAVADFLHAR